MNSEFQRFWVTGLGLKLRMSPFSAVVAKHSILGFEKRKQERHRCLKYFNKRLQEISFLEPHYVGPGVDMGAWYGFKPLYNPEKLNNIGIDRLVEVLRREGVAIKRASAPILSTQPLYTNEAGSVLNLVSSKQDSGDNTSFPNAFLIQQLSLSLPTFWEWEKDKPVIDLYIEAFKKVEKFMSEI